MQTEPVTDLKKKLKTNGVSSKRVVQNSKLMALFEDQLKDILWTEKELIKSIPRMISLAASVELIEALTSHLEQTKEQVSRLAQVFRNVEIKPSTQKCEAMEGLIAEATKMLEDCEKGPWCDANIIAAAQKIDHYEIATYGTLIELANTMGLLDAAKLLELTLKEEKSSDNILTLVAREYVNVDVAAIRG
ncbi:MAG: ferritin-like domain-containing protein [Balneolaceae bacterium]